MPNAANAVRECVSLFATSLSFREYAIRNEATSIESVPGHCCCMPLASRVQRSRPSAFIAVASAALLSS